MLNESESKEYFLLSDKDVKPYVVALLAQWRVNEVPVCFENCDIYTWQFVSSRLHGCFLADLRRLAQEHTKASLGLVTKRPPKAIFFDMDATVVLEESLVVLAEVAGVHQSKIRYLTERAMAGSMTFVESLQERVKLFAGVPASVVESVGACLTLSRGIKEAVTMANQLDLPCFLVSGGFHLIADRLAHELGFRAVRANRFGVVNGELDGTLTTLPVTGTSKAVFMQEKCRELNISLSQTMAVGDGANDRWMMGVCGTAIGHRPRQALDPVIHFWNRTGNHQLVLEILRWQMGVSV